MVNFENGFSVAVIEQIIRGPMAWIAFIIFSLGLIIQCWRMMRMTRKRDVPAVSGDSPGAPTFTGRLRGWLIFLRVSVLGTVPCVASISFVFHVCLLVTPVVVTAHNVLLDTAFGFSFVSLPERITDTMTLLVLFCGCFFLMRRIFSRKVRAISTPSDFMLLAAAAGPFLTGFLAYHHVMNYQIMITIHILSSEILLIMIPFSRFTHMIFFFISRLLIIGEHSRRSAKRVWHYQYSGIK